MVNNTVGPKNIFERYVSFIHALVQVVMQAPSPAADWPLLRFLSFFYIRLPARERNFHSLCVNAISHEDVGRG
jgi:hypothetical protein